MAEQKKIIANYEKQDEAMSRRAKVRLCQIIMESNYLYEVRCWCVSSCIDMRGCTLCCNGMGSTSLLVIPYSIS